MLSFLTTYVVTQHTGAYRYLLALRSYLLVCRIVFPINKNLGHLQKHNLYQAVNWNGLADEEGGMETIHQ